LQFFLRICNQHKILLLETHNVFLRKTNFGVTLALFVNFGAKAVETAQKKREMVLFERDLDITLEPISTLPFSIFSNKI